MADFTGFYLDDIHSSTYGLLRISNGDRYSSNIIPSFSNNEIELVGSDKDLYEGRRYTKTELPPISVAFDSITEDKFRKLSQWLGKKELRALRFDEKPYKTYWVQLSSAPKLDYICFLEKNDNLLGGKERIYKGEVELNFVAYDPFGYCYDNSYEMTKDGLVRIESGVNWQKLDSYVPFNILDDNVQEWGQVSGLKQNLNEYNRFSSETAAEVTNYTCLLYNPGDFETDFQLHLSFSSGEETITFGDLNLTIQLEKTVLKDNKITTELLNAFKFSLKGLTNKDKILLNTKNHSLTIYDKNGNKNLRYDLIKSTDWIKIPIGESKMRITCGLDTILPQIKYNYKYY